MKKQDQKITVKLNEENPEPVEIIAESIIKISDAFERINNGRLSQRAIVLLIQDSIKRNIGMNEIEAVLDAAESLKRRYIKELKKK